MCLYHRQQTASPSIAASKENQFPPSFSGFKFQISPWIPPWWGLRNRPWWTRSTTVKFLSSLVARSVHLSPNGSLVRSRKRRAFIIEDDSHWTFTFADYCKLVFLWKMFEWFKINPYTFPKHSWMILIVWFLRNFEFDKRCNLLQSISWMNFI